MLGSAASAEEPRLIDRVDARPLAEVVRAVPRSASEATRDGRAAPTSGRHRQTGRERGPFRPAAEVPRATAVARWSDIRHQRLGTPSDAWRFRWQEDDRARLLAKGERQYAEFLFSRSAVQPVQYAAPADRSDPVVPAAPTLSLDDDPFLDPFGDTAPTSDAATPGAPESLPAAPAEPLPQDDNYLGPPPALAPSPVSQAEQEQATPQLRPQPGAPPGGAATDLATDMQDEMPCDQIYNQRNCCAEERSCQHARERVLGDSIRNISLDITPRYTVARLADSQDNGYQRQLEMQLAKAPSRVWRNRDGEVLADGLLTDFREGKVVITEPEGETIEVRFAELSNDDMCFVTAWWSIPSECVLGGEQLDQRSWIASTMTWKASAVCHKPLYFEEAQLERYGHTAGPFLQPVLSGAHFFLSAVALPYQMGISPPNECEYALGFYRPGNCAPWLLPAVPLSVRGALLQTGAILGGIYTIP